MDLTPALIAAFASLGAAAIAATIALVVSVLSKEQKTSEMRQQWIDSIRADVSDLIAEVTLLKIVGEHVPPNDDAVKEFLNEHHDNLLKFAMLLNRIRLRLNPKEHTHFVKLLWELSEKVTAVDDSSATDAQADLAVEAVVVECSRILGYEWKRVKKGEPAFRIAKYFAITLMIAALATIAWLAYRASISSQASHQAIASPYVKLTSNPTR